jgi:chorismate synthase
MIDFDAIQMEMSRRKPGQVAIVTQRKEPDDVQFLSGILKVKLQEHLSVLLFQIPIRNQMITLI